MIGRIALTVATLAVAVPVLAATGASAESANDAPTVSDNANSHACFGQARASYASDGSGPDGQIISQRRGTQHQNNLGYIADHC